MNDENPKHPLPKWISYRLLASVIVLVTLIVYLPAMNAGFVWDDDIYLTENPIIAATNGLYRLWFTTEHEAYYPLSSSTLWFEWRLWGMNPRGYHATNVLLHALNALLIWRVLMQLKIPGAWLAALLFAVHPVNVASVAWISERKNVLALFFDLLAVSWFLRFDDGLGRRWLVLSLGGFLCALLSKSAVVMLPFVLLGCVWWRRGSIHLRDVLRTVPYFGIALALGLVTVWFETHRVLGGKVLVREDYWCRLAGAGWAPWFYLYKALCPFHLSMIYPRWEIKPWGLLAFLPGMALLAGLVWCWRCRESWGRAALFGLGYFVVTLFPVLGFFNVGFFAYSRVANHWQYVSIIGVIGLVVGSATWLCGKWGLGRMIYLAVIPLVLLAALSFSECGIYESHQTLWRDTVQKNPQAWVAHYGLGVVAGLQGRFNEAARHYNEALRLNPAYDKAHTNLGIVLAAQGRTNEAAAHFTRAIEINPASSKAHFNLGDVLAHQGNIGEAIGHYQAALAAEPDFASAHYQLAVALYRTGKTPEAVEHLSHALRVWPEWPEALDSLAWILATDPDSHIRDARTALEFATKACELTEYQRAASLETLAVAYAAVGQFEEARIVAQKALQIALTSGDSQLAAQIKSRLDSYRINDRQE